MTERCWMCDSKMIPVIKTIQTKEHGIMDTLRFRCYNMNCPRNLDPVEGYVDEWFDKEYGYEEILVCGELRK